ncbi:LSU ribosomal protein L24P [Brevinema andersonii]|uniref:Large ribosomal subunit protein uL24 n=1 Tax=Brevinema andersonii TaxID=34097 RepID=A0A1I1D004_BREAD|nr:50S ribosomal protein L24 [Brevinema andersonii]SFB68241.1 LSU ribosomal protein L24P [Brevinema andersonii]
MKIRKNDEVIVVSGSDKGRRGKVLRVFPAKERVLVQGVNLIKKTVKKNQEYPNGTILEKEASIHISNVMLFCPKLNKGVRVEFFVDNEGNKKRKAKGSDYIFE